LYFTCANSASDGKLYEINKLTGEATLKGLVGQGSLIFGLYSPYYENRNIPVAVQNLTATADAGGGLSATLNWTNPTVARSGGALNRISKIEILRNGTLVHTIDNPQPGAAGSWTDNTMTSNGDYTYTVYGVTDGDEGVRAQASCVIGHSPCDITTYPFSTSFESAGDLSCFQVRYYQGVNTPGISEEQAHTGNASFRFSSVNYSPDFTQYLISPRLAPSTGNKTVRFFYSTYVYTMEHFWVGYSTTDSNPNSFTWIDYITPDATGGWVEYFNVFPANAKYIAIRYYVMQKWHTYIDDMTIDVLADKDAEVFDVAAPKSAGGLTATEPVTVTLRNMGMESLPAIPLELKVDGAVKATETFTPNVAFPSLKQASFTFNTARADLSTPGKHTITVTAQVAGDGKPDNNSKTVEITNYGDCVFSLPFSEGFEDFNTLACWTVQGSPSNQPGISQFQSRTGKAAWKFTSQKRNDNGDYNQYLITPRLAAGTNMKALQFYYYIPEDCQTQFRIGYVTDDVTPDSPNWASSIRWRPSDNVGKTAKWVEWSVNAFPAATKYFVIHYIGSSNYGQWLVDDITVRERLAADLAITSVVSPVTGSDLGQEYVTVKVKNVGSEAASNIPVAYELSGAGTGTGSGVIAGPIEPGVEISYRFDVKATMNAAGTYTLKVYVNGYTQDTAHDNDTLTVTVNNYGPCKIQTANLPWEYGFEDDRLSNCWNIFNVDGDIYGHVWNITDKFAHSGSRSLIHEPYLGENGWAVMPKLVVPAKPQTTFLSFWQMVHDYPYSPNEIYISEGSPDPAAGNYQLLKSYPTAVSSLEWQEETISLNDYAGKEVYIAFRFSGRLGHRWAIDDLRIFTKTGADAAVIDITSPKSNGGLTQEYVTVTVKNMGATTLTSIPVKYDLNETEQYATGTISGVSLKPLETKSYRFDTKAGISIPGVHKIKAYTALAGDTDPSNDATTINVVNSGPCEVTGFPYHESFELPDELGVDYFICWTPYELSGVNYAPQWFPAPHLINASTPQPVPHDGNFSAGIHYSDSFDQDAWLVSPEISIPAATQGYYELSFWSFNVYPASYGKNSVLVSTGSANPSNNAFKEIWTPEYENVRNEWVETRINLADYAGQNIYIAFRYQGNDAHEWYFDDLRITALPESDAGASRIITPSNGGNKAAPVSVEITNYGTNAINTINAAYRINGQTPVEEEFSGLNILSGKTASVTFTQPADLSAYCRYSIQAYTRLAGDTKTGNDTAAIHFNYFENFPLYGYQLDFDGATSQADLSAVEFMTGDPVNLNFIVSEIDGQNVVTAGEYFNDNIYLFTCIAGQSVPANMVVLNGDWTISRSIAIDDMIDDVAYDYSTSTMYCITKTPYDGITYHSDLKTVNILTGVTTFVTQISERLRALACSFDGVLYGIDREGNLCIVNKTTGQTTDVGYTDYLPAAQLQSMAFDHASGRLLWAAYDANNRSFLLDIDLATGFATELGAIGDNAQIVALHSIWPRTVAITQPALKSKNVMLYPNPAKETVYLSSVPVNATISVIDLSGRVLQSQKAESESVTLSLKVKSGVYFIQIKDSETQVTRKLIVKI
jgi:hypothetical protein